MPQLIRVSWIVVIVALAVSGCRPTSPTPVDKGKPAEPRPPAVPAKSAEPNKPAEPSKPAEPNRESLPPAGVKPMTVPTLRVTSPAFADGQPVPRKYAGEGDDVSPPLVWTGVPEAAKELVLICDDPDAPTPEPWVHWVIYRIPAGTAALMEGVEKVEKPAQPAGAVQGKNSWPSGQTIGYRGPMPPPRHGVHHYRFHLYALDAPLELKPGLSKKAVLNAIQGHVVAEGVLTGTYQR